jgi:peptidyl-prolyl cis-trans isomerase C
MAPQKRAFLAAALFVAVLAQGGCGLGRDAGSGDGGAIRDPMVAATVNGRPIYVEDVRAFAVSEGWIEETGDLDANSDIAQLALEELIRSRLFAMEAEARGLDRRPDVRRQLEYVREQVLAAAVYEEIDQAATNRETIERLYRENVSSLGQGDEVHLRHIQFSTREAADAAKRRLDQGERFEALAFELSVERNTAPDGGDLGFRAVSDLRPTMRQEVERTATGALIGPIELPDGWHIFRLDDRRAIGTESLEEMRPRIVNWLRYKQTMELTERLSRDARIERRRSDDLTAEGEGAPPDARPAAPRPAPVEEAPQAGAPPPFPFPLQQQSPPPAAPAERAGARE